MKKLVLIALAAVLTAAVFAGCGGESQPAQEMPEAKDDAAVTTEVQDIVQDEPEPEKEELAQTPGRLIEPEELISREEAAALLGEPVKDGDKTVMESVGQKIVFYDPEMEGSFGFLQLSLTQQAFMPAGSTITPEEIYGAAKAGLDDTSDFEVSGIGDECFSGTPGLHILASRYYIVIGAGNSDDPAVQDIYMRAGEIAVDNLENILAGQ